MLQKGLQALRFAVNQQKQSVAELQTSAGARVMAKYWLKVRKFMQITYIYFICMFVCHSMKNTCRLTQLWRGNCESSFGFLFSGKDVCRRR